MGKDLVYIFQLAAGRHQVVMNPEADFTGNHQRGMQKAIERMGDHTLGRVFHRHHAILAGTAFHSTEDLVDRREWRCANRMAEMPISRLLGKRPFRPEEGNAQRLLQSETFGHQLAIEAANGLATQGSRVLVHHAPEDFHFPLGAVKTIHLTGRNLDFRDRLGATGSAVQQDQ